jgi:hypothetical protein
MTTVAVVLVLALVGAPLARAIPGAGCATCPPGCPMHKPGKLPCHQGSARHDCGARAPGIAPPGCGTAHEIPGLALPPAVLPATVAVCPAPVERSHRALAVTRCVRGNEPPDTPPPIVAS